MEEKEALVIAKKNEPRIILYNDDSFIKNKNIYFLLAFYVELSIFVIISEFCIKCIFNTIFSCFRYPCIFRLICMAIASFNKQNCYSKN